MANQKYQNCINACAEAAVASKYCATSDLNEVDLSMLTRCIRINHECSAIAMLAMQAMASESEFIKPICDLCAQICNVSAMECEKHLHMDHCKASAEASRKAALACLEIGKI